MKKGRTITRMAALAALLMPGSAIFAQYPILVTVNGEPVTFQTAQPRMVRGTLLVPLREVLERMGATVDWDSMNRTVSAREQNLSFRMMIGSHSATVNGNVVPVDVPAQIIDNSTMVPLRFVGEALGANVAWVPDTSTAEINTAIASANPSMTPVTKNTTEAEPAETPPLRQPPKISSLTMNQTGLLRPGTEVHFSMSGTPGGQATFEIPGVADSVPMHEDEAGEYSGTWMVPTATRDGACIKDTTAIGHLIVNGSETLAESQRVFSIDCQSPRVFGMTPGSSERVGTDRPEIVARLDDGAGSGIDPDRVTITLDGKDVTSQSAVDTNRISYKPAEELAAGPHRVVVNAMDHAGNLTVQDWTFEAAPHGSVARSLTFTKLPAYAMGTVVDFTLNAEPNCQATLSIGDRIKDVPMREESPGRYVAHYTVKDTDQFDRTPVRAHLKMSDGSDLWVESGDFLGQQQTPLAQPVIASPKENETVTSPLIIKGTAAPYATVQIHVGYSSLVMLNQFRIHGTLGDYSVTADEHGYFQSPAIDLDKIHGANVRFEITASTVNSEGKQSPETKLNVAR